VRCVGRWQVTSDSTVMSRSCGLDTVARNASEVDVRRTTANTWKPCAASYVMCRVPMPVAGVRHDGLKILPEEFRER